MDFIFTNYLIPWFFLGLVYRYILACDKKLMDSRLLNLTFAFIMSVIPIFKGYQGEHNHTTKMVILFVSLFGFPFSFFASSMLLKVVSASAKHPIITKVPVLPKSVKYVIFIFGAMLFIFTAFDFLEYQRVHKGLWDSGFRNYIHDRLGFITAL